MQGVAAPVQQEAVASLLTAVELTLENPLLLVPTQEEQDAFKWFAGCYTE
jgi:hypothetical protein